MPPTIFANFDTQYATSPLTMAVKQVAVAFGAQAVELLVDENNQEATIAVFNNIDRALRALKETERTTIVLSYFKLEDGETMRAVANRNDRMHAVHIVFEDCGAPALVPFLAKLIAEKAAEDPNAHPAP